MTRLVSDTSSLVSLGCAESYDPSALTLLFDGFDVAVPEAVAEEIEQLAAYEHDHRRAARAAKAALADARIITGTEIPDSVPPLDPGERAAIALANEKHTRYLLCDEFNNLTLIASALGRTELLTTPGLVIALVERERLSKTGAQSQLADIADSRSWERNAFYQRSLRLLDRIE